MDRFCTPVVLYKIFGQPIKKFRMRWLFPEMAKVAGSPNQSSLEMMLPESINKYPGSQWI